MSMDEKTLNQIIAEILDGMRSEWTVESERHGRLRSRGTPDIIITEKTLTPVIIETEWEPAVTVEKEAKARLGKEHKDYGKIRTVIAIIIPKKLKTMSYSDIKDNLRSIDDLQYVAMSIESPWRFPESGWLKGSLTQIAILAQSISYPQYMIDKSAEIMINSIEKNSIIIKNSSPDVKTEIAKILKQKENEETWKMASLVIQNAMLFYDQISGNKKIESIQKLKEPMLGKSKSVFNTDKVISAWEHVLTIDYVPIFGIALSMLKSFSNETSREILINVGHAVEKIIHNKMSKSGDMYGIIFQRLVENRRQLAAFYTLPVSATLLAAIAVSDENDKIWNIEKTMKKYRIADLSCGTGMLLHAAYKQAIVNYGLTGNDMSEIHHYMMENNLIGYDVLPIATHIAVASLSGLFPTKDFADTRVIHLELGKLDNDDLQKKLSDDMKKIKRYSLGSLSLLKPNSTFVSIGKKITAYGDEDTKFSGLPDKSCSLIIMNPPFTRNTRTGTKSDDQTLIPAFGAFGISKEDQAEMRDMQKSLYKNTCGSGQAGLGSYFIAIADRKLHENGKLALIILSTITAGTSWSKVRNLLKTNYKNLILVSINSKEKIGDTAFSADTGMSEVMLIATKRKTSEITQDIKTRVRNVSLYKRPENQMMAGVVGRLITHTKTVRQLESDVYGGTELKLGDTKIGEMIECEFNDAFNYNNIYDLVLLQFVYNITKNKLHVPREFENDIKMTTLRKFADIGNDHQLYVGKIQKGPFQKSSDLNNPVYPALWLNNAKTQTCMIVKPDLSLVPKPEASEKRIKELWESGASNVHFNGFLTFGSQKLVALYTQTKCVGGTSLPSIMFKRGGGGQYEKAFTVWANSTLGILCHWFLGSKQHVGRSIIGSLNHILDVPTLDFSELNKSQIKSFNDVFDKISTKTLLPVKDLHKDKTRIELDKKILNILDIESNLDDIRRRFVSEPLVYGRNPPDFSTVNRTGG